MNCKKKLLVFLFFAGLVGLFFHPVFLKGRLPFPGDLLLGYYAPWNQGLPHKAQGIDVVRQLFPWKQLAMELIKKNQLPFWNPYNFSGTPLLANFQSGVFYPFNALFIVFNTNLAWSLFIMLQPFLACWFTYLYLREIKVSLWGAVLGGLALAYGLYMTVWLEWGNIGHSFLWLPASLFLVERWLKKPRLKWLILLIFSLCASILAGYAQTTIYLMIVFEAYVLFRRAFKLWFMPLLAIGLTAFQILPTLELFLNSARQAYSSAKIADLLLPPFYLVTAFVSDFFGNPASRNYWWPGTYIERVSYIGVLPLLLVILAIIFGRQKSLVRFWMITAGLALIFSLNLLPVRLFYQLKIPLISTTVYTRLLSVFSFSAAILAGFGFDYCLVLPKKKILHTGLIFVSLYFSLWLFTFLAPHIWPFAGWIANLSISRRNLILPTTFAFLGVIILIAVGRLPKIKRFLMLGIVLITIADLYFYFQKITPFSPAASVYPENELITFLREKSGLDRFWGYGSGNIDTNFATATRIYSPDGYDPLFIRRYGELISASENGLIKDPIPRADVVIAKGFGKEALRQNPFRQRLLNLMGIKYLIDKDGDVRTFADDIYQLVWQENGWRVYENKQALPRAFLAGNYTIAQGQKIIDLIMAPDFSLQKTLVLEEPLSAESKLGDQTTGVVEITDYQANQVKIKTNSSAPGLLFLSDNYYPSWRAKIDSQPVKIYRADYTFRAVFVPAGEHQVIFSYRPGFFPQALALPLFSLIAIILMWRKKTFLNIN